MHDACTKREAIFLRGRRRADADRARAAYLDRGLRRRRRLCGAGSRRCSQAHDARPAASSRRPAAALRRPPIDPPDVERPRHAHRPLQAAGADRRRGHGRRLRGRADSSRSAAMVALKIIKPGMDTKQVIARFEAERQALAMMDHPNIAKVLDAGTTEVGPALLRHGAGPRHPDHRVLRPEAARRSASGWSCSSQVCQAVQHAHQKGIIHRDLKPSNVLVTLHDGVPVPKVIDFGVAKAIGQRAHRARRSTPASPQLVGTPLYMSPEQAEMNQLGRRYAQRCLFAGRAALRAAHRHDPVRQGGARQARPRRDAADHPRRRAAAPQRRVSTLQPEALSTTSQRRGTDPRRISAALRGELDWIVMKALEKDRGRRYESASAFATDIQRYLADEPVLACPPTTMYRFQKFARKHKAALATAVAIAACLILGTTVSAWQAVRATTAEAQANANATQARRERPRRPPRSATRPRSSATRSRRSTRSSLPKSSSFSERCMRPT